MLIERCAQEYLPRVLQIGTCAAAARARGLQLSNGFVSRVALYHHKVTVDSSSNHFFGRLNGSGCYYSNLTNTPLQAYAEMFQTSVLVFFDLNVPQTCPGGSCQPQLQENEISLRPKLPHWWGLAPSGIQLRGTANVTSGQQYFDGEYFKIPVSCFDSPVYQLGGDGGQFAILKVSPSQWVIVERWLIQNCGTGNGMLLSSPTGCGNLTSCNGQWFQSRVTLSRCPANRESANSTWNATDDPHWCRQRHITLNNLQPCKSPDRCCSVDCGNNGSCDVKTGTCRCDDGFVGARCQSCGDHGTVDASGYIPACTCADGYSGERCLEPPTITISGAPEPVGAQGGTNGVYRRLDGMRCNDQPVYQLQGAHVSVDDETAVLFQPRESER
eukprot:COSAG01_NODE_17393_length_1155_cov_1.235795_1_plen_384_part_11